MTVLLDALKTTFSGESSSDSTKQSAHTVFIESQLLPLVQKLQKEIGWRRYKECQAPLQEAVLALKSFAHQEWPRKTTAASAAADTADTTSNNNNTNFGGTKDDDEKTGETTVSEEEEAAAKESSTTKEEDDDENVIETKVSDPREEEDEEEDGSKKPAAAATVETAEETSSVVLVEESAISTDDDGVGDEFTTASSTSATASSDAINSASLLRKQQNDNIVDDDDDDPQTREPVHPAIVTTLTALRSVLTASPKDKQLLPKPTELSLHGIHLIVTHRYLSGRAGGNKNDSSNDKSSSSPLHQVLQAVGSCSDSNDAAVQTQLIAVLQCMLVSPKIALHESSLLLAVRTTFHVYLTATGTKNNNKQTARQAVHDMLRAVFFRMQAHDRMLFCSTPNTTTTTTTTSSASASSSFASQYHADAYYLFRCFCKLSSKELPADVTDESSSGASTTASTTTTSFFSSSIPTDPTELQSKLLSLELILAGLEYSTASSSGNSLSFGTSPKFLYLVQHYLCGSLLKNCVSNHTQVAFLSQKIFLVLVYKFKGHLKQEIEVFMSNVFFRVLESPNSSFKQKALVLQSLRSLCQDPVLLTQIFLNYDCDFDAMNLYKDIVHELTKLSGRATSMPSTAMAMSKKESEQDFELSLAAIECLVTILKAFLRALGLPVLMDDDHNNNSNTANNQSVDDTAGARIRGMLQLDGSLATTASFDNTASNEQHSVVSDDTSTYSGVTLQTASTSAESTTNVAGKIVDAFDRKRNAEQNFEIGAVKFTLSLKNGLNFFMDHGFVERNNAQAVALFFLAHKDKLDKTQMGEALGREPDAAFVKSNKKGDDDEQDAVVLDAEHGGPGFWVRILHHYANALDFSGIEFDEAIRLFLSGFRLPGEAQKIDRIMEKFAERFTSQNPDVFPNSDTAFILAFSVIMLNTDLHNPSIKPERRMTVESFMRNNRGINDGADLPEEFLTGIFNRIKARPFSLKEDDAARERAVAPKQLFDTSVFFEGTSSLFGSSAEERKREKFNKERDEMMAVTEQLIRRRPDKKNTAGGGGGVESSSPDKDSASSNLAESIPPADAVKPMFDVTWGPMLGILSQVLECADDERSVAVCLNGFVYAVRLAAHSDMSLARDTFVSSLAKFTFLGSIKEMKRKNVESIRTLLSIAVIDGEYLGESWGPVLQCMSQLAKLRLSASGLDSDESFLMVESPKRASGKDSAKGGLFRQHTPIEIAREAEENNGKAVLEAVQEVLIDKVFSSTVNLSAKSLASFIAQLIVVASSEISGNSKAGITGVDPSASISDNSKSGGTGASIFSLQRLVDVADYNMDVRPRLVWSQVWELMADFFVNLACHENTMISVFAIDSLKQLSFKFLEKPELSEFNFQCSFLQPFLVVMEDKKSREDIRELVLQCIDNIVRTKSHNLRSGWKVVFSILTVSAGDPSEKIEYLGLAILQRLLDEHLDDIGTLAGKNVDDSGTAESMSVLDKRTRNVNADDFVSLCRTSLSFVQFEESDSLRPFGLTMRAFCHTAIYADLLASQRVLPPVSGAQWSDPNAHGYTYESLSEMEGLAMALWRPLFEGLAEGIRSTVKTSASGVGCLVQRGSILALRSILLRHGHLFSTPQLAAVLRETIIPAIQFAAENDQSHVVGITSESPIVSNIDFLVDPLPLPPDPDDPALLELEAMNTAAKRPVGPAELMLEASFTLLRHGADGDLRKAHLLAKKKDSDDEKMAEQPFPDSWLATTAPIALGLLTDITSEFVVYRETEGREQIWPLITAQYKLWCLGRHQTSKQQTGIGATDDSSDNSLWSPCEALVRIASREMYRLPKRMWSDDEFDQLSKSEQMTWVTLVLNLFSDIIGQSSDMEDAARRNLLESKDKACFDIRDDKEADDSDLDEEGSEPTRVETPFGSGRLMKTRIDNVSKSVIFTDVIKLDFGATLYRPTNSATRKMEATPSLQEDAPIGIPSEVTVPDAYWVHLVPLLKIRCVTAHCLQQSLVDVLDQVALLAGKDDLSALLGSLEGSRRIAARSVADEDVSTAFQEALLKDWGEGVHVPDEAMETKNRLSLLHGSAKFFLTQEAGATRAIIHVLSILYLSDQSEYVQYAEQRLVVFMSEVLNKFLESEERDGHLIDPSLWRNANEIGGKLALYCTSFASVVIDILKTIRSMPTDQFAKHKRDLFPPICSLVRVHSEEIRNIVQDILAMHVAPMIEVDVKMLRRTSSFD